MASSRSESAAPSSAGASPGQSASSADLASYIEEMTHELEKLARSRGLKELGDLLRGASDEARRARRR